MFDTILQITLIVAVIYIIYLHLKNISLKKDLLEMKRFKECYRAKSMYWKNKSEILQCNQNVLLTVVDVLTDWTEVWKIHNKRFWCDYIRPTNVQKFKELRFWK